MSNKDRSNSEFAEAFSILARYYDEPYSVHAEHDVLYAGGPYEGMLTEDKQRLMQLGWSYDSDEFECWYCYT